MEFILNPSLVKVLSWGTKEVHLDGKTIVIPKVKRRWNIKSMWEQYAEHLEERKVKGIGYSSFFRVAKAITGGRTVSKQAVDYVLGTLVNDTFCSLLSMTVDTADTNDGTNGSEDDSLEVGDEEDIAGNHDSDTEEYESDGEESDDDVVVDSRAGLASCVVIDVEEEVEREEDDEEVSEGNTAKISVVSSQLYTKVTVETDAITRLRRRWKRKKCAPRPAVEQVHNDLFCEVCKKQYYSKVFKEKHVCQPKLESDLVSFSLRHFVHLWETGNMGVIDGRDEGQTIDNVRQPDTGEVVMWDQGWAEKRKQGEMYGKNFTAEVRDDLVEMFMQGVDGKSKKMNATQMLDCLKAKYPQRWDLPSEAAIGSFLSSFSASQKKARGISESRKNKLP